MFVLETDTGEVAWSYDGSRDGLPPGQYHGQLLVSDELVVAGTDAPTTGHLYAFDRATGEVRWKLRFPKGVATDLLLRGDAVLFVSELGDVAAVELARGAFLWRVEDQEAPRGGTRPLDALLADDRLIVAWRSGTVDAYDVADGRLLWRRSLGGALNAAPVLVGGDILVGGFAGTLHRLRVSDGEEVGFFDIGGALYGDLVSADGCLLALSARGGFDPTEGLAGPHALFCLNPDLQGIRWRYDLEGGWSTFRPAVEGGVVVAGTEGRLLGLALDSGAVLWERPVPGAPRGLTVSGRRLFVGTRAGSILALSLEP